MNDLFRKEMPNLCKGLREVHKKARQRFNLATWVAKKSGPMEPIKPIEECGFAGCALGWKDRFIRRSPLKIKIVDDNFADSGKSLAPCFGESKSWFAVMLAYGIER